jgi:hypothetical protein
MSLNIGTIFADFVEIEGEVQIDTAELEQGQNVDLPATITIGSVGGKPIYLIGELTTTKPTPLTPA